MTKIDTWFLENLVCPVDRGPLLVEGDYLVSENGRKYPIIQGIPVMLADMNDHNLWVGKASLEYASQEVGDSEDPFFLSTVGVDDDQREAIKKMFLNNKHTIDPVVSYIVAHTCGIAYKNIVGHLTDYPIPILRLEPGDGSLLLDIGCNWGRWSVAASRLGYDVVGLDPSLGAVLAATRVAKQLGLTPRFVVGDAKRLPFRDGLFSTVFSYSVLQHFPKPDVEKVLRSCAVVVRKEGRLFIQMPNQFGVRSLYHQLRRCGREADNFEVRYWGIGELKSLFEKTFGPVEISIDCFFGLGLQPTDSHLMKPLAKGAIAISEVLRKLERVVAPLKYIADSVYVKSTRS